MLVIASLLGLVLGGLFSGPPVWAWLVVGGGGLAHSLAWRAAGVRKVSGRERRAHAVRLRNADKRARRHLRATLRMKQDMKSVLAEVREHPGMDWANDVATAVRALQDAQRRTEGVLVHHKLMTEKTAAELRKLVSDDSTPGEDD